MATTLFRDTTYTVRGLVEDIAQGTIALPDIQRPFVWQATKVRELLDSMYKGFPVGYLLFWETGADATAKQIGSDSKQHPARLLIVDGQQRLTSLYSVMEGKPVLRADYSETRIKIAFRPSDATFSVSDAAIERDPEYISDVSLLWQPGERKNVVRGYLKRLKSRRDLTDSEEDALEEAIDRLHDLSHYPFKAVELSANVDEEQVSEIFVRINSEGVTLNQADFILTLMSVFWEQGRIALEEFSRQCKTPTVSQSSPFNWFIEPMPAQLLRSAIGLGFRRARLKNVYTILRGKDLETGRIDPARRDAQFEILQGAQKQVLDLTNWHEFLSCLERAGHRSEKMISSENSVLFTYALWLIGRIDYKVSISDLKQIISRWFFMAHLTGRYSGSFETQFEQDVARFRELKAGDAAGFIATLDDVITDTLTSDFWSITLPNRLATSSAKSPELLAYIAALNILDADALLSTDKVRSRLDPYITAKKGIERHHLFPKAYLKKIHNISSIGEINQIANMAMVIWSDNIEISDTPPHVYWPDQLNRKQLPKEVLEKQMYLHALPESWETMKYSDFLDERRKLMAVVVRDGFNQLGFSGYSAVYPAPNPAAYIVQSKESENLEKDGLTKSDVALSDLINSGILDSGPVLKIFSENGEIRATLLDDGSIEYEGEVYGSPSGAAKAATGRSANGWYEWFAETSNGAMRLSKYRREYLEMQFETMFE